jgi:hypothetical protein
MNQIKSKIKSFFMKHKKLLIILLGAVLTMIVIFLLLFSVIAKWFIEKYDVKFTGREITMDWAYVNPFTGYAHLSNLKIYELKSDTIFISAKGLTVNFSMLKLLTKTYEISELSLEKPIATVIQNKKSFNFDDIIEKFKPKENSDTTKPPVHFNILNVKIADGTFYYRELVTPINYFITHVNIESSGKLWNSDTIAANFSFLSGIGSGGINGKCRINIHSLKYALSINIVQFGLDLLEQYLKDLTNYGTYSAILDAHLNVIGDFKANENVAFSGFVSLSDFQLGKNMEDTYASFDKLSVGIFELSPKNHKYLFDTISIINPYFKYERYDQSDNLHTMFGNVELKSKGIQDSDEKFNLIVAIGNYIVDLSRNFFKSDYKINSLELKNGSLNFSDYSLGEKFSLDLSKINIAADSIDKIHKRVNIELKSGIEPFGSLRVAISVNPKDSSDFDMNYQIKEIPLALFNPYIVAYTSFPFDRGTLEIKGDWNVRKSKINSVNHLIIIDPRVCKRLKNEDTQWLPIPLLMALVRENGNVIDYEIPIKGDLKNPKFNLGDVFSDLFKNIFVKPPSTPYRMIVKTNEKIIEKSLSLKWQMRSSSLSRSQEKFLDKMVDFLMENPDATINVHPQLYSTKEKEHILFYEAKKKFYMSYNNIKIPSLSEKDSLRINKMSVKDSLFVRYVNKHSHDPLLFTMQDKCANLIHSSQINNEYKTLNNNRKAAFLKFFKEKGLEKRVHFLKKKTVVPFNGFSFYKIEYKKEFPESLMKAYEKMDELNKEKPRKKYFEKRTKKISKLG